MKITSIRTGWLILVVCISLILSGCSGRITPPTTPETPRAVFVLDHGQHSSLVIEDKHGNMARYSYGDWRYYAEGKTSFWSGLRAVFAPTKAALGRKQLSGPATLENVYKQVRISVIKAVPLEAEASAVDALQYKLETIYLQNQDSKIYRQDYDLEFVHHPMAYSVRHNSNQIIGQWLTELGSEIHGWQLLSNWQVRH
ncbi:hypothetical protein [Methylophaga muralis]|uniref:Lipoprotein n=1 Tax=Methylophaga muralis TaxID=291169 RepID=A0A1E3GV75_9GAMM|nr:hypothetical protein [Methylophaga muralis]ODN67261.1 hypothetical protein A9E74_00988 [Methylophaga muralis]